MERELMDLAVSHRHLVGIFDKYLMSSTASYLMITATSKQNISISRRAKNPPKQQEKAASQVLHHLHLGVEPPVWWTAGGLDKVAGYTWTSGHDGLVKVMMVLLRMMVKIKKSVILTRLGGSQQDGKDLEATRRRSHQNLERFLGFKLKRGKIIEYMAVAT